MSDALEAPRIRWARPDEAATLSDLAFRSKRMWGYSDAFMARVRPDLLVTAGDIERDRTDVIEAGDRILGYCRLLDLPEHAELEDLFIDPGAARQGLGRRLFRHAVEVASGWGQHALEWDSDPNAEPFYLRLGAIRIGEAPSALIAGRWLPRMRMMLNPSSASRSRR